jgi:hypothetical protein
MARPTWSWLKPICVNDVRLAPGSGGWWSQISMTGVPAALALASSFSAPAECRLPVTAHQRPQLVFFTFQRIAGAGDQQLKTGGLQPIAQALRRFCKDRVRQIGQQRGHDVAHTAGQQAGLFVGHITGLCQRRADALCGVGGHDPGLAQKTRHGDGGDTSGSRHVLQRHAAMATTGLALNGCSRGFGFRFGHGWGAGRACLQRERTACPAPG